MSDREIEFKEDAPGPVAVTEAAAAPPPKAAKPACPPQVYPAVIESVILLGLLALTAWTCWLLYAPQIAAMLRLMLAAPR